MPIAAPTTPIDRGMLAKGMSGFDQLIARKPGLFPSFMTGAGPAAVGRTVLGAGIGYGAGALASSVLPNMDQDRAKERFAVMGGMAGAASSLPDLYATTATGHSLFDGNFAKTASDQAKGWVGVPINGPLRDAALELAKRIDRRDLLPDGRETKPHVTVAYGLHTEKPELVAEKVKGFAGITLKLGRISLFKHPHQEVVKVAVTGTNLHRMHHKLHGTLRSKRTHKRFFPHLTLAFVKPGTGAKYIGTHFLRGRKFLANKIQFNHDHGLYHDIPLTKVAADSGTRDKMKAWAKTTDSGARNPHWKRDLVAALTKKAGFDTDGTYPWQPYSPISTTGYTGMPAVDINSAANSILANPNLQPAERAVAFQVLSNAANSGGGRTLSAVDLLRGAVGAGLGLQAGAFVGRTFGPLYGRTAGGAGAALGFLVGSGTLNR